MTAQRLLTVHDVAEILRVSTMTTYRLIGRGDLPALRVGRGWRVRQADLDRYLAQARVDVARAG